ncbi:hypothetical protein KVT40_000477 [Elsinoe batatas]|uniref:Uncharacterized protein n=1 Tax=Elsinoe batatas TaxID=2601811 RepID=A0A8K0PKB3_9PEZI|nr:hypothetical protein KVT40_000477 [Elsinoe batatas]
MERTIHEVPPTILVTVRDHPRPIPWSAISIDGMGLLTEITTTGTLNLSQTGRAAFKIMVQWAEDGTVTPHLERLPSKTNVPQLLADLGQLFGATCEPFGDQVGQEVRAWLLGKRGLTGWDLRCLEEVFEGGDVVEERMEGLMVDWFVKNGLTPLSEGAVRRYTRQAPSFVAFLLYWSSANTIAQEIIDMMEPVQRTPTKTYMAVYLKDEVDYISVDRATLASTNLLSYSVSEKVIELNSVPKAAFDVFLNWANGEDPKTCVETGANTGDIGYFLIDIWKFKDLVGKKFYTAVVHGVASYLLRYRGLTSSDLASINQIFYKPDNEFHHLKVLICDWIIKKNLVQYDDEALIRTVRKAPLAGAYIIRRMNEDPKWLENRKERLKSHLGDKEDNSPSKRGPISPEPSQEIPVSAQKGKGFRSVSMTTEPGGGNSPAFI